MIQDMTSIVLNGLRGYQCCYAAYPTSPDLANFLSLPLWDVSEAMQTLFKAGKIALYGINGSWPTYCVLED